MKPKYFVLSAVLTIALTLPMFGLHNPADTTRTALKESDMSSMMGKPTTDATVGGVQMKVWLMTEAQHKEMIKATMDPMPMHSEQESEMGKMEGRGLNVTGTVMAKEMKGLPHDGKARKDTSMSTDNDTVTAIQVARSVNKATIDSTTAGTHYIVLDVTEIASGKDIAGASARVLIESPSKMNSTVDLKAMMEHFGGALTLNEKGEYRFSVDVSFGGVTKTTQFQYAVK